MRIRNAIFAGLLVVGAIIGLTASPAAAWQPSYTVNGYQEPYPDSMNYTLYHYGYNFGGIQWEADYAYAIATTPAPGSHYRVWYGCTQALNGYGPASAVVWGITDWRVQQPVGQISTDGQVVACPQNWRIGTNARELGFNGAACLEFSYTLGCALGQSPLIIIETQQFY